MLTTNELARMRAVQEAALPDECTIRAATAGVDDIGQPTLTWADLETGVACRLAQRRVAEVVAGERVERVTGWVLTVPQGTTLTAAHRVVVGGRTFEVVGVNTGESWETVRRAEVVEVS